MEIELAPVGVAPAERREPVTADEACTAESAECTCPEFCERDHDND